ncbi:autotransporter-associated beta strand protein [Bradyrhizobium barranii subsp. barranii]
MEHSRRNFFVGFLGAGTLNIQNGGRIVTGAGTVLANSASSSGTLNISGGGILETQSLRGGSGASQANFDNGILQATASNATFINGFSGTRLNILAGGLTIDTGAFTVGTDAASAFTGAGGLTKIGSGTLNLAAAGPYAGQTVIQAGILALTGAGSISNSSRVVANGTFDISGITAGGTSIQSLAGNGGVSLGAKNLTITNANDTFAGVIGGAGGLTVSAGAQTLTGANTYNGATNVSGGTLRAGSGEHVQRSVGLQRGRRRHIRPRRLQSNACLARQCRNSHPRRRAGNHADRGRQLRGQWRHGSAQHPARRRRLAD